MKSRFMMPAVTLVAFILGMAGPVGAQPATDPGNTVLILGSTVIGGAGSLEATTAAAQGFTVEVATSGDWLAKSEADFASYRAIILGDPNCEVTPASLADAETTTPIWGPAIEGNVIIIGTDPRFHSSFGVGPQGGDEVTAVGIAYAAGASRTGAYISLSCYYFSTGPSTPVPVLSPFGSFTVIGQGDISSGGGNINAGHIVTTSLTSTLTDATLTGWGLSVHEGFDLFDSSFEPYAISEGFTGAGRIDFPDASFGIPYILTAGGFAALVEPDGENSIQVFSGVEGEDNDGNPFIDFLFQKVEGTGVVTGQCCKFKDLGETSGSATGRGRFGFYDAKRNLDIRAALEASVDTGFDPDCADVFPLIPVDGAGKGLAIAKPWQRIYGDPDGPIARDYSNPAYVASLVGAFCVIQWSGDNDGVTLSTEDPFAIVGYKKICDEDDPRFRPVTGTISLVPGDPNVPDFQTSTHTCNGGKSGRRSSDVGYWINMSNDTTQNSPFALVSRHMSHFRDEIVAIDTSGGTPCVAPAQVTAILDQWEIAKESINREKRRPARILDTTVPLLNQLTRDLLRLPSCPGNPKGLADRSLAATFLACSYLGHPDEYKDECVIDSNIEDHIRNGAELVDP